MESRDSAFVLGQRYTLASIALGLALLSFLNLAGLEKAVFAIALGLRALRPTPAPPLQERRRWAHLAMGLAAAHIILLVTIVLFNMHRIPELIRALRALDLQ